ncbi:MAG: ABC transporter permease [bacterium]|nr:ABC transporter permease [bacterium]
MFYNYFLSALRNLRKTKLFSLINVLGLSIGMASCLLILHYVDFERSYDKFYESSERIYRLCYNRISSEGKPAHFASCTFPAAARIRGRFPEVERIARIYRYQTGVAFGDTKFREERMYMAEPQFLDIFKLKFIETAPKTMGGVPSTIGRRLNGLEERDRALISQSTAKKYFGAQNPMGKILRVNNSTDFKVVGIFEDIPHNSHLKFDLLLSYKNMPLRFKKGILSYWGQTEVYTYLRLKPGTDPGVFKEKLDRLVTAESGKRLNGYDMQLKLPLQPLEDIHLTSHYLGEYEINGNRDSVNLLFMIAFITIVLAWVNYINLSTAYVLTRTKETALRKMMGASRMQLMVRFLMESSLMHAAAVFVALVLVELALPYFSSITGIPMSYGIWLQSWFKPVIAAMFLVGVFLAGLYPVLVMSSFAPADILKRLPGITAGGINLRKALVVFQFVMALVLVTGTLSIYDQLRFMKNHNTGFDMNRVLVVKAPRIPPKTDYLVFTIFKEALLEQESVKKVCISTAVPGRQVTWEGGGFQKPGEATSKGKNYMVVGIDYDYVDLFDLKLAAGRNFSREFPTDTRALLVNETACEVMGFENAAQAVGKDVMYWKNRYRIAGVLKDFHQQSVKEAFEPHVFLLVPPHGLRWLVFSAKVAVAGCSETVARVKDRFEELFPNHPFSFFFLDEHYNRQFQGEELVGKVIALFAVLALVVTCMGIYGLSSFMVLQRTKEIGIRKALGAGIPRILLLLTSDFWVLLGVSFAISLPFSLYVVNHRLESFAIHINPGILMYILPLGLVAVITMLTIGIHVLRTSLADPVKSLRYE